MNLLFELDLAKAPKGSREIADTLYRQLEGAIRDGRLKPGARLPSTRSAQTAFGVSRNTAHEVYERLIHEGLATARHGSGTFVSCPPSEPGLAEQRDVPGAPDARLNGFWLRQDVSAAIGFWQEPPRTTQAITSAVDLRPALIDPRTFPFAAFRRIMVKQLRRLETRPASFKSPQGNQGNFHLRRAIADHIALTRAVACHPEEILVTSGAQQAFDLIARALVKPGETVVAVEDPGYPPMRVPFAAAGARLVPVRVDAEGLVVGEIPPDANIVCVCPSHQFPLGMSMSPARRRALVQFAARTGAVIVEDDYDGEFRFDGKPLEALRTTTSRDEVFYVGSFSKCMLPSLRLGFIIPPRWARDTLVAAKNALDWNCSVPLQLAVAAFIAEGHLSRHVRRLRRIYGNRRDHLLTILDAVIGETLQPIPSSYGMHITALADDTVDCEAVSAMLAEQGIHVHALDRYYLGAVARSGFVLSYASADEAALVMAVEALAQALASLESQSRMVRKAVAPGPS